MVAYNPYNKNVYVTNFIYGNVTVLEGETNKVVAQIPMPTAAEAFDVLYNPSNHNMYASHQNRNTISVIDSTSNEVTNIDAGWYPLAMTYDSKDNLIWITHYSLLRLSGPFITAIDASTNNLVANITLGADTAPMGIVYDPVNDYVYVAMWRDNVTVIDGATKSVSRTNPLNPIRYPNPPGIPGSIPESSEGLVYDPQHNLIFVTSEVTGELGFPRDARGIWVIDPTSNTLVGNFTAGYLPTAGVYDPDNGYVYISNYQSGTLSLVSADSLSDFGLELTPSSIEFTTESTGSASISLTSQAGFTGTVTLSINSTGLSTSLNASTVALSKTHPSKNVLASLTGSRPGNYDLTITGTSGARSHSLQLAATIVPPVPMTGHLQTLFGLTPLLFFSLSGTAVAGIVVSLVVFLRRRPKPRRE